LGITVKNDFTGFQILHQSQFFRILKFRSIVTGLGKGGRKEEKQGRFEKKRSHSKVSIQTVSLATTLFNRRYSYPVNKGLLDEW
jgi:hypothetical protein